MKSIKSLLPGLLLFTYVPQQSLSKGFMQPHTVLKFQQQAVFDEIFRRKAVPSNALRQRLPRHGRLGNCKRG